MGALDFYEFLERLIALEDEHKKLTLLVTGMSHQMEKNRKEFLEEIGKRDGVIAYLRDRLYSAEDVLEQVKNRVIGKV